MARHLGRRTVLGSVVLQRGDSAAAGGCVVCVGDPCGCASPRSFHVPARFTSALARFWPAPHGVARRARSTDQASKLCAAKRRQAPLLHSRLGAACPPSPPPAHRHLLVARAASALPTWTDLRAAGQRGVQAALRRCRQPAPTRNTSIIGHAVRRNGPWSELPTPLASSLLRRRAKGRPEPSQTIMPSPGHGIFAEICPAMMPSSTRDHRQHPRRRSPMPWSANYRRPFSTPPGTLQHAAVQHAPRTGGERQ